MIYPSDLIAVLAGGALLAATCLTFYFWPVLSVAALLFAGTVATLIEAHVDA